MKKIYSLLIIAFCIFSVNAQKIDRSTRPVAGPAKEINIKDAETFTLPNGLKVFVVEDKSTPIAYYSLQLDVTPALEGNKAGMYSMFSDVFGKVTKNRTKEQLNKDLDLIGARGRAHLNGGSISFLKKYQDQALDILSDMILHPAFPQEEFDLALSKYKTGLQSLGDDAGMINDRVSTALTYGKGIPYGEIETEETLNNITLADLENYYNTYFAPNVTRLVIVGNISVKEAKAKAEQYFGQWQKKNVPVTNYVIPTAPAHNKVAFINKPGAVQSSIDVSYPVDFKLGVSDYDAARIMDDILGGSGTGHLFMNLREDKSWTYGVYSSLSPDEYIGRFNVSSGRGAASIKHQATDSAVFEILKEMHRIINEPVTADELKAAKTYRAGSFSRSLENSGTIASFAINIDKYNLPKDYYKNYLKRLDAVTAQDVQNAAKRYIKPENAWIIVTADKQYADKLTRFASDGKVQWYDMHANPVEAEVTKSADITPNEVIDNYVKALGGKAAIDNLKDFTVVGEMDMMGQTVTVTQYFQTPNMNSTIMSMNGMLLQKSAFDGKTLRVSGMQGNSEYTEGPEFDAVVGSVGFCPEANYVANAYTLSVAGIEKVGNADAYVLNVTKDGKTTLEYYDVATGLKLRSQVTQEVQGMELQVTTDYSDYRDINGLKFPFNHKESAMGQSMETKVKEVLVNTGLDASLFK